MFLAVTCQHASGACQSHSHPVLSLREALQKYVELSLSTPLFLTLQFHKKDLTPTLNLLRIRPILPLLGHILSRGSKPTGSNLWTELTDGDKPKCEEANNLYDLPSTKKTIRYLHTSTGHPVEDTWTKAVKPGNFTTWPGLSVKAVHKYFPELDETKQGVMNKQCQNVRSTKLKINPDKDEPVLYLGNHDNIPTMQPIHPQSTTNRKQSQRKCKICLYKSTTQMTQHIVTKLDASL
jgi:hypothetical protein